MCPIFPQQHTLLTGKGQVACPVSGKFQDETNRYGENLATAEPHLTEKAQAATAATAGCLKELGPEKASSETGTENLQVNRRPTN